MCESRARIDDIDVEWHHHASIGLAALAACGTQLRSRWSPLPREKAVEISQSAGSSKLWVPDLVPDLSNLSVRRYTESSSTKGFFLIFFVAGLAEAGCQRL